MPSSAVGSVLRFWTHFTSVAFCFGAWAGAFLAYLESSWLLPVLLVSVGLVIFGGFSSYRAVELDPKLSEAERSRIKRWFKQLGPAAVVQLLLFIHFPGSKFAGH